MRDTTDKMKPAEEITLWEGKKHHLGMPVSFTSYRLTRDRIIRKSNRIEQIQCVRVQDIRVTRSPVQWLFGVGTVTVISDDRSMPELKLKNIRNPECVKEIILRNVEEVHAGMGNKTDVFMK